MTDPIHLAQRIDQHEGAEPAPYLDSLKLWTIGKGRCLETHPFTALEWKRLLDNRWISVLITDAGMNWLRDMELANVEAHLAAAFSWWAALNDARQNALIEMAYQMGLQHLFGFEQMLKAIQRAVMSQGPWADVFAHAMNSEWAKETPSRALEVATQLQKGVFA